jgi:mono/diheme cytochrome c family protein
LRRRTVGIAIVAVLALLVAAGAFLLWTSRPDTPAADAGDAALVALGKSLYAQHCAVCHGRALEGQPNWRERMANGRLPAPPHDESGHTWHHSDEQLFGITKHGMAPYGGPNYASDMPAFADRLSDREIWAILAFIKSTWPARIRQLRTERLGQPQ